MPRRLARPLAAALALAALAACGGKDQDPPANGGGGAAAGTFAPATDAIVPQPLHMDGFPVDSTVILGWANNPAGPDSAAMRGHAWALWAGLTFMTTQTANGQPLPVYETWLSRYEVYDELDPSGAPSAAGSTAQSTAQTLQQRARRGRDEGTRGFHQPLQFTHTSLAKAGAQLGSDARTIASVKYNMESATHVWEHLYTDSATLDELNAGFAANTPVASRNIVPFHPGAMATKPVYWVINQTGLTIMPYWAGPDSSTNPVEPSPNTWTQFVAVDPTGSQVGDTVSYTFPGDSQSYQVPVISLDSLFSFQMDQDEVDAIVESLDGNNAIDVIVNGVAATDSVSAGDYAALVAMHVNTKEIGNWTWQTFWWTPNPSANPLASDAPASVLEPFNNYAMKTAYYMTVPAGPSQGQDEVTFNPYLETDLGSPQGIQSNCMSCHRTATWPGINYIFNGNTDPGSAPFANQLKLDFLWSIQAGASFKQASTGPAPPAPVSVR